MQYEENELLITTEDIGSEEKGNLIPAGSEVNFIKVVDNDSDLAKALIAFRFGTKILVTLESNVRPKDKKKLKNAHKEFNKNMMRHHPRTRRYQPNRFLKVYFRIYYFISDLFGRKKEV